MQALYLKTLTILNICSKYLIPIRHNSYFRDQDTKKKKIVKNINIPNFSFEFTPINSTAGGTLIYITDHLTHQKRNDLTIYSKNYLESNFTEIMNPSKMISL